jgi:hypothetical protein
MQHSKVINNLLETNKYCSDTTVLVNTFTAILKEFKLSYINSLFSKVKNRGFAGAKIFELLFVLRFIDVKNIQQLMSSGFSQDVSFKKDVFYDFLKNAKIDWRNMLQLFNKQFGKIVEEKGDKSESYSPKCLILDDTQIDKTGKTIEFIGKVYDHCTHKYTLGMKVLTLGFWDEKSFTPQDFSIHNEPGKKGVRGLKAKELKAQFSKTRQEELPSAKRVKEVSMDKIEVGISMIKNTFKKLSNVDYVLADSWFICEKFISEVTSLKSKSGKTLNVIGLMKSNRIITIGNKKHNGNKIPEVMCKNIKYSRLFKAHYINSVADYKGIPMRIFWVRLKGQNGWKMLVSTDQKLTFAKAMKYYQIRWCIEVFFKDCKQNLNLCACQSTDFDAQIAHITICFMQYIALTLKKRFEDYETFGELFRSLCKEITEMTLVEKIWVFLVELFTVLFAEIEIELEIVLKLLFQNKTTVEETVKKAFACLLAAPGIKEVFV